MTRGRTSTTISASDKPQIDEQLAAADVQQAVQLATLQQGYGQGRDLVNQLLGQAQAFQAAGDLLRTFGVSKLAIVKENKLYQQLAGTFTPNGSELRGTWAEFCNLLGISDDKANQDIANLQTFGEEALEQMQRVGIGYRDLRQFRRLPLDQKSALIEAAKSGDKDTLLELAEDLIAKHAKEKETLAQSLADKDAVIVQKSNKIEELVEDKNRRDGMTAAEALIEMESALNKATLLAIGHMAVIRKQISDIRSLDRTPHGLNVACANTLQRVISEAVGIANDWGIALDLFDKASDPEAGDPAFDDPNAGDDNGADWLEQAK
jgi:hypothetical protein